MKKSVSVVVVTKNRYKLLLRALKSIDDQEYYPIEVVLIDNQSTDPLEIQKSDFKNITINIHRTKSHLNSSEARNYGISFVSGDYICFLDDDDYYLNDKISASAECLDKKQDIQMVYGSTQMLGKNGEDLGLCNGKPELNLVMLYRYVHLNSVMIRKEVFKQVLFDESLNRCIDVDFTIRVIADHKTKQIDKVFAVWNRDSGGDQITKRGWKSSARNWLILCKKHENLIKCDYKVSSYYYSKMAGLSLVSYQFKGFFLYLYFFIRFGWLAKIRPLFIHKEILK